MIPTSIVASSALVMATDRCQDFPSFPNQSHCVSRKLVGMNFIAQSIVSSTCDGFRLLIISLSAASWLIKRRICDFQSTMLDAAQPKSCCNSSRLPGLKMERVELVNIMARYHHFSFEQFYKKNNDSSLIFFLNHVSFKIYIHQVNNHGQGPKQFLK